MKFELKIKKIANELNEKLFNNSLNLDFPFKASKAETMGGYVRHGFNRDSGVRSVIEMRISSAYNFSDKQLVEVIAHELIHVYEIQVLKQRPDHSHDFLSKMNEINLKHGLEVSVTLSGVTKTKVNSKGRKAFFVKTACNSKIAFFNTIPKNDSILNQLKRCFGQDYVLGMCEVSGLSVQKTDRLKYSYRITDNLLKDFKEIA